MKYKVRNIVLAAALTSVMALSGCTATNNAARAAGQPVGTARGITANRNYRYTNDGTTNFDGTQVAGRVDGVNIARGSGPRNRIARDGLGFNAPERNSGTANYNTTRGNINRPVVDGAVGGRDQVRTTGNQRRVRSAAQAPGQVGAQRNTANTRPQMPAAGGVGTTSDAQAKTPSALTKNDGSNRTVQLKKANQQADGQTAKTKTAADKNKVTKNTGQAKKTARKPVRKNTAAKAKPRAAQAKVTKATPVPQIDHARAAHEAAVRNYRAGISARANNARAGHVTRSAGGTHTAHTARRATTGRAAHGNVGQADQMRSAHRRTDSVGQHSYRNTARNNTARNTARNTTRNTTAFNQRNVSARPTARHANRPVNPVVQRNSDALKGKLRATQSTTARNNTARNNTAMSNSAMNSSAARNPIVRNNPVVSSPVLNNQVLNNTAMAANDNTFNSAVNYNSMADYNRAANNSTVNDYNNYTDYNGMNNAVNARNAVTDNPAPYVYGTSAINTDRNVVGRNMANRDTVNRNTRGNTMADVKIKVHDGDRFDIYVVNETMNEGQNRGADNSANETREERARRARRSARRNRMNIENRQAPVNPSITPSAIDIERNNQNPANEKNSLNPSNEKNSLDNRKNNLTGGEKNFLNDGRTGNSPIGNTVNPAAPNAPRTNPDTNSVTNPVTTPGTNNSTPINTVPGTNNITDATPQMQSPTAPETKPANDAAKPAR